MNWDQIEVKWAEMTLRVGGTRPKAPVVVSPAMGPRQASATAGPEQVAPTSKQVITE